MVVVFRLVAVTNEILSAIQNQWFDQDQTNAAVLGWELLVEKAASIEVKASFSLAYWE